MKNFLINFLLIIQLIINIEGDSSKIHKQTLQSLSIFGYITNFDKNISDLSIEIYGKVRNVFSVESKNVNLAVFNKNDFIKQQNNAIFIKKNIEKIKLINPYSEESSYIQLTDIYVNEKSFHQILSFHVGPYLIENVFFQLKNINFNGTIIINIKSHYIIPPFLFHIIKKKDKNDNENSNKYFKDEISIFCTINSAKLNENKNLTCITYITKSTVRRFDTEGYICRCSDFPITKNDIFNKIDYTYNKSLVSEKIRFRNIFGVSKIQNDLKPPNFIHTTNEIIFLNAKKKKDINVKVYLREEYTEIFIYMVRNNFQNYCLYKINIKNETLSNDKNKTIILEKDSKKYIKLTLNTSNLNQTSGIKIIYGTKDGQYFQTYTTFKTRIFKNLRETRSLQFFFDDCHYISEFLKRNFDEYLENVNSSLTIEINKLKIINIYKNLDLKNVTDIKLIYPSKVGDILCGNINKTKKIDLSKVVQAKVVYRTFNSDFKGNLFNSYLMFEFSNISKEKIIFFKGNTKDDYFLANLEKNNAHLWIKHLNLQEDKDKEEFIKHDKSIGIWIWVWSTLILWMLLVFFGIPIKNLSLMKYFQKNSK